MDWFSFWFNSFTIIASGCLHLFFFVRFTEKKLKIWYVVVHLLLLYATIAIHEDTLAIVAELLIFYGVNRILLQNSHPVSCITTILADYVAQLSFGVVNSLAFLIFPVASMNKIWGYLLAWLTLFVSLMICFCCYWLLSKQYFFQNNRPEPYIWMLLPPALFLFAVELYIFRNDYSIVAVVPYPAETGKQFALLVLQILGLVTLFCTLYAYKRTCDGFKAQAVLVSLEQEAHAQKNYVTQAKMRYEQTRAFRHDIKNHLIVLDGLLKEGNVKQAQSYLYKLQTVTGELSFPIHTGSPVVDVLLGDKLELARTIGAKTELSLILPSPCGVNDLDLCVIFANALDNAIQACADMKIKDSKWIDIVGEQQGDFYMLEFKNTCSDELKVTIGTGLSNIQTVAEKYGGAITLEKNQGVFCLNVLLNISVHIENTSIPNP